MKGFLKNIIIKAFLICIICFVLGILTYSMKGEFYAYYEQDEIVERANEFKNNQDAINTVFIGSSRIFRHINPFEYDSLVEGANSYNLGYAGLFPYRSYDYLNHLALEKSKTVKKVFIELSPIALLGQNYNTDPFIYSANLAQYLEVINFCITSPHSPAIKLKYFGGYSLLLAYKYLGIGASKYINHLLYGPSIFDNQPKVKSTPYHKGYLSLDEDYASKGDNLEDLTLRKEGFDLHYAEELKQYLVAYQNYDSTKRKSNGDSFSDYILKQAKLLTSAGIEVAFIISPRQELGDLLYVQNQKMLISDFNVYDFSNPSKYPELFTKENSFDRVHLNKKGSSLFTQYLAKEVNNSY